MNILMQCLDCSTIVLPKNTELSSDNKFAICMSVTAQQRLRPWWACICLLYVLVYFCHAALLITHLAVEPLHSELGKTLQRL